MTRELMKDILQWDVKSWSKALTYWENSIDWDRIQNCLELGAGNGGLSLWLALKNKTTVCSDVGDVKTIEERGERLCSRYNISSRVKYQEIDATNIPYDNFFDLIVFRSIIGSIGRNGGLEKQQKAFNEIFRALKPGGNLLFAENLVATPFHMQLRKRFSNWPPGWRYISINEMKEFLKEFSCYEIKTTGILSALGRNEVQRNVLSALDEIILNKLCSDNWKYVAYGIAKK